MSSTDEPMKNWWWMSFADESGHLGAAIVAGNSFMEAHSESWRHGVNPGGELQSMDLGMRTLDALKPYEPNRLYTKAEMEELDGKPPVKFG